MTSRLPIEQRLVDAIAKRSTSKNLRQLSSLQGIDFCSNDYLSLSQSNGYTDDDQPHKQQHNIGSTGSRLISGDNQLTRDFEAQVAQHHGYQSSLLFSSGYSANSGLLASLGQRGDVFLMDELAHASLIDGARLSFAKRKRFTHNDVDDCRTQLASLKKQSSNQCQIFVVVESIYSMDGDRAPLAELCKLCDDFGAALIVDEAHSIGVDGERGEGYVASLGLQAKVFANILTFGKAMGCHGAVVSGSQNLRDYLINFCRPFIYTTASSPHTVALLSTAHQHMCDADKARQQLSNIQLYFDRKLKSIPLQNAQWCESNSPIQALKLNDAKRAKALETYLLNKGFAVKAILSPTVAEGSERLRICLHSHNTAKEIDQLSDALMAFIRKEKAEH